MLSMKPHRKDHKSLDVGYRQLFPATRPGLWGGAINLTSQLELWRASSAHCWCLQVLAVAIGSALATKHVGLC